MKSDEFCDAGLVTTLGLAVPLAFSRVILGEHLRPEVVVIMTAVTVVPIATGRVQLYRKHNAGSITTHPPVPKTRPECQQLIQALPMRR